MLIWMNAAIMKNMQPKQSKENLNEDLNIDV